MKHDNTPTLREEVAGWLLALAFGALALILGMAL